MTIGKKMKALLHNNGSTQKKLAEQLNVAETTVQKWCAGKNIPPADKLWDLSKIFNFSVDYLLNENINIPTEPIWIDTYIPYSCPYDSPHDIYDAGLIGEAKLHRFKNPGGAEYSAIFYLKREVMSQCREKENEMIAIWNTGDMLTTLQKTPNKPQDTRSMSEIVDDILKGKWDD